MDLPYVECLEDQGEEPNALSRMISRDDLNFFHVHCPKWPPHITDALTQHLLAYAGRADKRMVVLPDRRAVIHLCFCHGDLREVCGGSHCIGRQIQSLYPIIRSSSFLAAMSVSVSIPFVFMPSMTPRIPLPCSVSPTITSTGFPVAQ